MSWLLVWLPVCCLIVRTAEAVQQTLTAESNITFLAFIISRPAVHTVHRAFPSVRIVTAAVDAALEEVRFPLNRGSTTGQVAGDGDFTARLVATAEGVATAEDVIDFDDCREKMLEFGRRPDAGKPPREKVAWVIKPGMGQIGWVGEYF